MSDPRLPRLAELILVLVRGAERDFVIGDLVEGYGIDLSEGVPPHRARQRLVRAAFRTLCAWYRPDAVVRRWNRRGHAARADMTSSPADGGGMGEMMGGWAQDVRLAWRSLSRRPGFSMSVALTLGLGIGATTTIFSVVDGVLLRPLPYDDPGQLAAVGTTFPTREWADEGAGLQHLAGISMLNYLDFRERTRSFATLAGVENSSSVLLPDVGEGPELASAATVSAPFFDLLGVSPVLGRTFLPDEYSNSADPVYMITHGAWQRRFAGDPDIVGRSLGNVGIPATIVGVLPADFRPPESIFPTVPDFWMPLEPDHPRYESRGMRSLYVLGRLAQGTTLEGARDEAREIAATLAAEFPDGNVYPDGSHFGIGVNGLHEQTVGSTGRTLRLFLGASALLLLLAGMNAATLLLARGLDRMRELGVRVALGAGRARMVRLLLAEATLLAIVGGAIGVGLAFAGVEAFLRYAPSSIPRLGDVAVDGRVLLAAAGMSMGAGVLAGLVPAMRLTARGPWKRLHGRGTTGEPASRVRGVLVAGQMTVAVVLLSGAGLLFASFVNIVSVEPGFEPDGLITMNISLKRPGAPEGEEMWQGWDLALAELEGVAGVTAVAGASNTPFQSPSWGPRLLLPGDAPETWREGIAGYSVTPGYRETLGIELVAGRDLELTDGSASQAVALVNEAFVRLQLDGEDPLGMVMRSIDGDESTEIRIVGVVGDVVQTRAEEGRAAAIYMPYTQAEWPFVQALVRTTLPDDHVLPELRKAVARFSPVVPPRDVRTMRDRMSATRTTPRFQTMLIGAFAAVALLLAAAGLYGSLSHAVGRRRRELGVRMALGAEQGGVVGLVLRQGMGIVAVGLGVGLVATLLLTGVLSGFLFGVTPNDPRTLVLVALVLSLVSMAACLVPALRATSVDPAEVLRTE